MTPEDEKWLASKLPHTRNTTHARFNQTQTETRAAEPASPSTTNRPRYSPLKSSEFRVLVVKQGTGNEPISCHLRVCSLQKFPQYKALSYTWGNPIRTRDYSASPTKREHGFSTEAFAAAAIAGPVYSTVQLGNPFTQALDSTDQVNEYDLMRPVTITVDGLECNVSGNLAAALCQLRLPSSSSILWVDALSIDQSNLGERNSQVSMMGQIYSQAIGVISWLGRSTPASQNAFQIIRKRLFCPDNAPARLWDNSAETYSFDAMCVKWPSTEELETDQDLYRNFAEVIVWPAMADILRRTYWSRLWVVQEMIVAAKCTLLCGTDAISLEDFVVVGARWVWKGQFFQASNTHASLEAVRTSSYQDVVNTWRPIEKISLEYREQYREDRILLMELVDSFASKQCSNVRDKVFALRTLSKEAASITVDYSKTTLEVFLSLVRSGLLMSDSGRGFQSLPHLIRCLGIDHDTLNEQIAELSRSVIHLDGRLIGTIVAAEDLKRDNEAGQAEHFDEAVYVRVTDEGKHQQAQHYRCSENQRASEFLQNVQPGDMLFVIESESPILLLLRPLRWLEADVSYQAVDNLQDWGCKRNPLAQLPPTACLVAEVRVSRAAEVECSQTQRVSIEGCSLRGLTFWKSTVDKWYSL